jgi:hypothetical protein
MNPIGCRAELISGIGDRILKPVDDPIRHLADVPRTTLVNVSQLPRCLHVNEFFFRCPTGPLLRNTVLNSDELYRHRLLRTDTAEDSLS